MKEEICSKYDTCANGKDFHEVVYDYIAFYNQKVVKPQETGQDLNRPIEQYDL